LQDATYSQSVITAATSGIQKGYSQLEFEAAVVEDLMEYKMALYQFGSDETKKKYKAFIEKLKNGEDVSNADFNELMAAYVQKYSVYNKPINPAFAPSIYKNVRQNCK
jgi:hypothetical protein